MLIIIKKRRRLLKEAEVWKKRTSEPLEEKTQREFVEQFSDNKKDSFEQFSGVQKETVE